MGDKKNRPQGPVNELDTDQNDPYCRCPLNEMGYRCQRSRDGLLYTPMRIWLLPISSGKTAASARLHDPIPGGSRLCWSFSDWARFSCTPTGPPGRMRITPTAPT